MTRRIMAMLVLMTMLACKEKKENYTGHTIPVDSANKMLGSYLNSIGYIDNDSTLRSLSFDADVLRSYLTANPGGLNITNIKVMFAHTLDYINEGHGGVNAGYRSGALTLVMAGYDSEGNYILFNNAIVDNAIPCPVNCPPGDAGNPLISASVTKNE